MQQIKQVNTRQLLILVAGAVAIGVLGFFVSMAMASVFRSESIVSDRIALYYTDVTSERIPLTSGEAEAAGWDGSIRCILGKGRFYQKAAEDGPYPLIPMYNREDRLIGLRIYSKTPQPTPPWQHEPGGLEDTQVANMDFEQWSTGIYLIEPSRACGVVSRQVCPTCVCTKC